MLDAILLPIGEGNRILAQISDGKIDELIAQTYKGDHEKMKQAVNNVAVVLQGLQKELARLTEASRDGLLSERGKPEQFKGAYAEVVGRRQPDARRHPAAHWRRQPHPGADFRRQDRRADRADLQGRPRKDEAGRQQRGRGPAGPAEGISSANRRIERWTALRTRQAGAVPGCLRRSGRRRQPDARRHPAAHRRRQPHPGADFQRQDRRVDRANLQGRPRKDEAGRQHRGHGPAEPGG